MINLGGGLNNIISDVIDDTISGVIDNAISGVEKYSKKHKKNKNSSNDNLHDISTHINQASSNSSDIKAFGAPSSKKNKKKDKKKAKKNADIQADKECKNDCFCEQDLNKSKLNKLEHDKLTKEEYKRKQLRNAFIMSEVLSEPMCKKRHKR